MDFLSRHVISQVAGDIWGGGENATDSAVLFKEKINFKLPNGGGFLAHQDSVAYIGLAQHHISVMIAVDKATEENGCLYVAPGKWNVKDVPLTAQGTITPEAEEKMNFIPCRMEPAETLLFSGYLPHRSNANLSSNPRRAMFLTYNKKSEGDHHGSYYKAKKDGKDGFGANKSLSFIQDFTGTIVD